MSSCMNIAHAFAYHEVRVLILGVGTLLKEGMRVIAGSELVLGCILQKLHFLYVFIIT